MNMNMKIGRLISIAIIGFLCATPSLKAQQEERGKEEIVTSLRSFIQQELKKCRQDADSLISTLDKDKITPVPGTEWNVVHESVLQEVRNATMFLMGYSILATLGTFVLYNKYRALQIMNDRFTEQIMTFSRSK